MAEIIKIALILDIELFEFLKDKSVAYFRDPKKYHLITPSVSNLI